jgi:hypothetical protein
VKRSDKRLLELSAILEKSGPDTVIEAVKALRDEEAFEGAIALLASFYDQCTEKPLLKTIEGFFNDVKDKAARAEVINEIRKPWKHNTISMLVASCWQSGLDYSDYLADFVRTFLKADYATSIECMTVIEESVQNSTRAGKDEIINIILESPQAFMNEKNVLVHELMAILEK